MNKQSEYNRRWRIKNPEKHRQYVMNWKKKHPEKAVAYVKDWQRKNKDRYTVHVRRAHLKKAFGITIEEYDSILKVQGGVCVICKSVPKKRKFAVDHNHETGEIRGILCGSCNMGLGYFKDNITLLRNAILYLGKTDIG